MDLSSLVINIEEETLDNIYYRKVIHTGPNQQLVLMNIRSETNIGYEVHPDTDQFIRIESGSGLAKLNDGTKDIWYKIQDGTSLSIPAGTWHDIINDGFEDMKLYTIYSPPHHPEDTLQLYRPF